MPHQSATRPAGRFTARRARRHAARAGHRARAPLPDQGCCTACCRLCSSPACSEHSARVLRSCAPAAPRQTRHRSCTARSARGARCARAPPSVESAVQPACTAPSTATGKVHVHAAQSKHSAAARTPRQSPASRRARACRTQYCAHCIILGISFLKNKPRKQQLCRLLEQQPEAPITRGRVCVAPSTPPKKKGESSAF